MPDSDQQRPASAPAELAQEVAACAVRTLAEPSARVELQFDWRLPLPGLPRGDGRADGVVARLGRLTAIVVRAAWRRATRSFSIAPMVGEGILEPASGRFMVDYGSFATLQTATATFGGRSGRPLDTLKPFPTAGRAGEMLWLLRLLRGTTAATPLGDEVVRGTRCRRLAATVDLERAAATSGVELPPRSAARFDDPRAVAITVWIDDQHVRRVELPDPRWITLELWDFGTPTADYDWSRLPSFQSPD